MIQIRGMILLFDKNDRDFTWNCGTVLLIDAIEMIENSLS